MDNPVIRTDDDALAARASAVKVGYWSDDFIKCFVKTVERKPPIINRGTFVRTYAIDSIVSHFLKGATPMRKKQIVSLGAGSDTRYFSLAQSYLDMGQEVPFRYHEIDFPHVCQRKSMILNTKKALQSILKIDKNATNNPRQGSFYSNNYCLHPLDLERITESNLPFLEYDLETLVISEVCLVYMEVRAADRVLEWTRKFESAIAVIYEPINSGDAFGLMMVRNLAARGLELKTMQKYTTLELQRDRLRAHGYQTSKACTMNHVYDNWLSEVDKERISHLEMFDEVEEWTMLAEHYCILVGWRNLSEASELPTFLE